jgi:general secretion pathway protein G
VVDPAPFRDRLGGGALRKKPASGFSLLEITVVVILVAIFYAVALERLIGIQADAERVAMENLAGIMRSALGIKVAEHIVKQDMAGLAALVGSNPVDRLTQPPGNYLGSLHAANPAILEDGNWYFDEDARSLVYLVRHGSRFEGGLSNPARARFSVELVYTDKNRNGRYDTGVDAIEGVKLSALEPYRWTP